MELKSAKFDLLSPETLAAIQKLAKKATPGPWKVRPSEYDDWGWVRAADGKLVASTYFQARKPDDFHQNTRYDSPEWKRGPEQIAANAEYIAALSPDVVLRLVQAAQREARERLTWQPIDTAPKDGTWLLTTREKGAFTVPVVAHWSDRANGHFNWNDSEYTYSPSHWMPLPLAPRPDAP